MLKNLTAWNKLQFKEYVSKTNKYDRNFSLGSLCDSTGSYLFQDLATTRYRPILKPPEVEGFYPLPGIPLSDSSPVGRHSDFTQKETEELEKLSLFQGTSSIVTKSYFRKDSSEYGTPREQNNGHNSLIESGRHFSTGICSTSSHNIGSNVQSDDNMPPENHHWFYSRAADNLRSFLEVKRKSKDITTASVNSDLSCRNNNHCEKAIQTSPGGFAILQTKPRLNDKSIQTIRIVTKNSAVSAEFPLKSDMIKTYLSKIDDNTAIKMKNKESQNFGTSEKMVTSDYLKTETKSIPNPACPKGIPVLKSYTKKPDHRKDKIKGTFDYVLLSDNEDSVNKYSKDDDSTVLSLSNSKLTSFNLFKEKTKKSALSQDKDSNQCASFWDHFLKTSDLDKSMAVSFSKTLLPHSNLPKKVVLSEKNAGDYKDVSVNESVQSSRCNGGEFGDVGKEKYKEMCSLKDKASRNERELPTRGTKPISYACNDKRKREDISAVSRCVRSYYLSPYDDLVKSHLNSMDRRIKSVSGKNECSILIEGPISSGDSNSSTHVTQTKVAYRCTISSAKQDNLDRCVNYLKETFPNTCLRSGITNILK